MTLNPSQEFPHTEKEEYSQLNQPLEDSGGSILLEAEEALDVTLLSLSLSAPPPTNARSSRSGSA